MGPVSSSCPVPGRVAWVGIVVTGAVWLLFLELQDHL